MAGHTTPPGVRPGHGQAGFEAWPTHLSTAAGMHRAVQLLRTILDANRLGGSLRVPSGCYRKLQVQCE